MRAIDKIIIHCSATPQGRNVTVDDIRRWHTTPRNRGGRGWKDIGYHYVVCLDGSVQPGRPEEQIGAHCLGHNRTSIGVCYVGGLAPDGRTPRDTRTPAQRRALDALVERLRQKYPGARVYGHNQLNPGKACPCFRVKN